MTERFDRMPFRALPRRLGWWKQVKPSQHRQGSDVDQPASQTENAVTGQRKAK